MDSEGIIFNIKRFSVHDGPGIRTSIFLKGCPLNCAWCHNPEGISRTNSIWYNRNICIACGECVKACPENALTLDTRRLNMIVVDRSLCKLNGDCVSVCPTGAISFTGSIVTVSEVLAEIRKDTVFYESSGGGVTLTGGEPLFQLGFCLGILKACKEENFDTAVESCLLCEEDVLRAAAEYTDHFLADLKIFDTNEHRRHTGSGNERILKNIVLLNELGKDITVRVPLIKGFTASDENRRSIEEFVKKINPGIPVEYLDFNPLTRSKYQKLDLPFDLSQA
jgi:pyruvate formate lyase activating enzyme